MDDVSPPTVTEASDSTTKFHNGTTIQNSSALHTEKSRSIHHSVAGLVRTQSEHWSHLRGQRRLFFLLAALTFLLAIINIIQACCIQYINTIAWLVAFPLGVLGAGLAIIAWDTSRWRHEPHAAVQRWKHADVPHRIAWGGVVASMLLPVIICQFIYMPLVAHRQFHDIKWDSAVSSPTSLPYPSILMSSPDANLEAVDCTYPAGSGDANCEIQTGDGYCVFNAPDDASQVAQASLQSGFNLPMTFTASFTSNSTFNSISGAILAISVSDPLLTINTPDTASQAFTAFGNGDCGVPNYGSGIAAPLFPNSLISFQVTPMRILNADLESEAVTGSSSCANAVPGLSNYTIYTPSQPTVGLGGVDLSGVTCTTANSTNSCSVVVQIYMQASIVQSMSAAHGTDTVRILVDEGGIIGGILFFTWFFSIYVV